MEYCKKCGAAIDPYSGRCTNCGQNVQDAPKKKGKLGVKLVVAVIVILLLLLGGKLAYNGISSIRDTASDDGYMDVVEDMVNIVYIDYDLEKFAGLMPDAVVQSTIDQNFDGDEQAFYATLQEAHEVEAGNTAMPGSVTWDVNEELDVVGVQLDRYEEVYQSEYGVSDKIKSAKALDITVSYTDANGEAKQDNLYLIIGMIDGEWCLIDYSQY